MVSPARRNWKLATAATFGVVLVVAALAQAPLAPTVPGTHAELVDHARRCSADPAKAPEVTAPPAEINEQLDRLHAVYDDLPGFVDVYFIPGMDPVHRALFVRDVPPEAYRRATSTDVAFHVLPAEPTPLDPGSTPSVEDARCTGLRPGARLTGGCTVNFIYTDGEDFYVGTAGHCIDEGQVAVLDSFGKIGEAVFSTGDGGVGNDFALIKVDEDLEDQVDPEMCTWAGPTGTEPGDILGQPVLQAGYGSGVSVPTFGVLPPRPRPGVGMGWGAESFTWIGTSIPGDSGSPVRESGGEALGTVTHILIPAPVLDFGTTWDRGLELAGEAGIEDLELVTVDYLHPI